MAAASIGTGTIHLQPDSDGASRISRLCLQPWPAHFQQRRVAAEVTNLMTAGFSTISVPAQMSERLGGGA
jgi:hypothetical protein